jgi:DNA-binding NtrC family response regulator
MAIHLLYQRQPYNHLSFIPKVEEVSQPTQLLPAPQIDSIISPATIIGTASTEVIQWNGNETILFIEDEAFVRKATAEALELAGYTVIAAESAGFALEISREKLAAIHLLISDVIMPGMSGHELANELAAKSPHLRILLISGYAEKLNSQELSAYRKEYLAKPFSFHVLLRKVREILDSQPLEIKASA